MFFRLIFLSSVIYLSLAYNWEMENGVVVLTKNNIDKAIQDFPALLVEFYAPWCPHCQKLQPEFSKAASELAPRGITLGKVDCTSEHELQHRYDIRGYPTLRVFVNQLEYLYEGHRSTKGIVEYMTQHIQLSLGGVNLLTVGNKSLKLIKQSPRKNKHHNHHQRKLRNQKLHQHQNN